MFRAIDDELLCSEVLESERVLVITRKNSRVEEPDALRRSYFAAVADPPPDHARWTVIVDSRIAPPPRGAETEAAIQASRDELLRVFGRMIVVIRSAVGRLQATRYQKSEIVCDDMDRAFEIARAPLTAARPD